MSHLHDLGKQAPPHRRSPVGHVHDLEEEPPPHGRSPVRVGEEHGGESLPLPVASFTSGVPLIPGRGFHHDGITRTSSEQEYHKKEHRPGVGQELAEDVPQKGMPSLRFSSKSVSRKKMKATRKGRKSLRPPKVGEGSRSFEDNTPTSQGNDGDVGEVLRHEDDNIGDIPPIDAQSQNVEPLPTRVQRSDLRVELNVSSLVEEVAAVVMEVLGQG